MGKEDAMPITIGADYDALAELARKAVSTEISTIKRVRDGDVPFIVVDKGRELKSAVELVSTFEKTQAAPYRRRGIYVSANVASMLAWMNDHCDESAPVFGEGAENLAKDWEKPKLSLIGIGNYSKKGDAAWHDFAARYDFPVTLAWTNWVGQDQQWLSQGEFAEFIEGHLYEFSEPERNEDIGEACTRMIEALGGKKLVASPSMMYELGRGVKLNVAEKVEVSLDRSTGESAMKFSEEHSGPGGRPVKIPKFFYIRVPVFFGEQASLVGALLRYRNEGGGRVSWSYQLFAPDLIVKAAFEKACEIVKRGSRTLYLGTPDRQPQ